MEETQGKKAIMLGGLSDLDLNLLEDFGLWPQSLVLYDTDPYKPHIALHGWA